MGATYKMLSGNETTDAILYADEYQKAAKAIKPMLPAQAELIGFGPGILFRIDNTSLNLPDEVVNSLLAFCAK